MANNRLIISAAGAGKTTYLVNKAIKTSNEVLFLTYTIANEQEIRNKFFEIVGFVPENVSIMTWFKFLLKHGIRPYQNFVIEKDITGMLLVNSMSGIKYRNKNGIPIAYKEDEEMEKHYFDSNMRIYSDKISKFVIKINRTSSGKVFSRLSKIFKEIYIDEVQDLAGYDLDILNLLFESEAEITIAGDPRQVTYLTHLENKYKKYRDGKIEQFVIEKCIKGICIIDKETLKDSHRNNQLICDVSNQLYPDYLNAGSLQSIETFHDGIFIINERQVNDYLSKYNPVQLRYSKAKKANNDYLVYNFGDSKGKTFDRVMIYPTTDMIKWLKGNKSALKQISKAKFYVALTRAKHSVAIVYNNNDIAMDGIKYYKF